MFVDDRKVVPVGDNTGNQHSSKLSRVYRAEEGGIFFLKQGRNQHPKRFSCTAETIYQDLALAENLNVYSNIFRQGNQKILVS